MRKLFMVLCLLTGSCFAGIITDTVSMPNGDTNVVKELKVGTSPASCMTPGFVQSRQLDYDFPAYYRMQVDRVRTNSMAIGIRPFALGFGAIMEDNNPSVVMSCGSTNSSHYPTFVGIRWRGNAAAPSSAQEGDMVAYFQGRVWDGFALRQTAGMAFTLDPSGIGSNAVPSFIRFINCGASGAAVERLRIQSDGSLRIFNMTTAAGSVAGGGLLYATNGEIHVKDASGNVTQISPHNDAGEYILESLNEYTGKKETLNVTQLGLWVQATASKEWADKIYQVTETTPSSNWEADQQQFKAERDAEIETWVKAPYEEREQLGPMPLPYYPKPVPAFAEEKQQDLKDSEVTK